MESPLEMLVDWAAATALANVSPSPLFLAVDEAWASAVETALQPPLEDDASAIACAVAATVALSPEVKADAMAWAAASGFVLMASVSFCENAARAWAVASATPWLCRYDAIWPSRDPTAFAGGGGGGEGAGPAVFDVGQEEGKGVGERERRRHDDASR